jgi:hypothetical protein
MGAGMTDRELLEMALEALDNAVDHLPKPYSTDCANVASALHTALSRKALDELAEIDRELGLDYMQPDLAKVGEVGVWVEQKPVTCQHKRYSIDVTEQIGTCIDCGSEGRMRFVVDDTQPPKQEPVIDKSAAKRICAQLGWEPEREWQGLTEEELRDLRKRNQQHDAFARSIEAKLKEKNK